MEKIRLYRKISASHQFGIAKGGWLALYLAPDHLLLRTSSSFVESYRRFYFADIEAVTICESMRGTFWNAAFAFGLFVALCVILGTNRPHIGSGICSALFALFLVVNVARGKACRTQLQTRVQTHSLPLRRVRPAMRFLAQLSEKINAAQASLPAPEIAPGVEVPMPASPAASLPTRGLPPPLPGEPALTRTTWLQRFTIASFGAAGGISLFQIRAHSPPLAYVLYALVGAVLGLSIAVLVQQRRRRLRTRLLPVAWVSVAGHAIALPLVLGIFSTINLVQESSRPISHRGTPQMHVDLSTLHGLPGFDYVLAIYGAFALLLAAAGLLLLITKRVRATEMSAA